MDKTHESMVLFVGDMFLYTTVGGMTCHGHFDLLPSTSGVSILGFAYLTGTEAENL